MKRAIVLAVGAIPFVFFGCSGPAPGGGAAAARTLASSTALVAGGEFQISQANAGSQDHAAAAMTSQGRSMVVWHTADNFPNTGYEIKGRLYGADGLPLNSEFVVNAARPKNQIYPDISTDGNARFVVVWTNQRASSLFDVYARVFSADGVALTGDIPVNSRPCTALTWPAVAMYDNGNFVVIWDDDPVDYVRVYARIFDPQGSPLTAATVVNDESLNLPRDPNLQGGWNVIPDIAVNRTGSAIGVWRRFQGNTVSIVSRVFDPYTLGGGTETVIDAPPQGVIQQRPQVEMSDAGDVVIAWTEWYTDRPSQVCLRRYDAAAARWQPPLYPDSRTTRAQTKVAATFADTGETIAAWSALDSVTSDDICLRIFDARGNAVSSMITVNQHLPNTQDRAALATAGSRLFVTWESLRQDGDDRGIFGRIFERGTTATAGP